MVDAVRRPRSRPTDRPPTSCFWLLFCWKMFIGKYTEPNFQWKNIFLFSGFFFFVLVLFTFVFLLLSLRKIIFRKMMNENLQKIRFWPIFFDFHSFPFWRTFSIIILIKILIYLEEINGQIPDIQFSWFLFNLIRDYDLKCCCKFPIQRGTPLPKITFFS